MTLRPCLTVTLALMLATPVCSEPAPAKEALPTGALVRLGSNRFRQDLFPLPLAFSPDGKYLAYGTTREGNVPLLNAVTGEVVRMLGTSSRLRIVGGQFLGDSKRLLVATADGVLHVWKTEDGSEEKFLGKVGTASRGFFLSDDGKTLLAVGTRGEVTRLDPSTGKAERVGDVTVAGAGAGGVIFFSPDGKKFVIPHPEKGLNIHDAGTGEVLTTIPVPAPRGLRPGGAFSPDGKILALALSNPFPVRRWDLDGPRELAALEAPAPKDAFCHHLLFARDGKTVVAVSEGVEANVVIWDNATGKVRHTIGLMSPNVRAVALARDSRTLAVVMPGYVRLFDVVTGKALVEDRGHLAEVVDMRFSADGKQLISACSEGSVRVWDTATGRNLAARDLSVPYRPTRVVFHPDLKAVLVGGPVGLRDVPLDPEQPVRTHFHPEEGSFSRLYSASADGRLVLFRQTTGKPEMLWNRDSKDPPVQLAKELPNIQPLDAVFSPDGRTLAVSHSALEFWDVRSGTRMARPRFGETPGFSYRSLSGFGPGALAYSPDGRCLAALLFEINCWETETGGLRWNRPRTPGTMPASAAFSPDSSVLAVGTREGVILVLAAHDGQEVGRLRGESATVSALAFSQDGQRLASADRSTILIWDVRNLLTKARLKRTFLKPEGLTRHWQDLRSTDPKVAVRAITALAGDPEHTVPFLQEKLSVASKKESDTIDTLLVRLNDQKFAVREAATAELTRLGWRAEPALRLALENKAPEVRKRAETILTQLLSKETRDDVDLVQQLRGLEVLERIGTADAATVAAEVAQSSPGLRLKVEAQGLKQRLGRKP